MVNLDIFIPSYGVDAARNKHLTCPLFVLLDLFNQRSV